MLAWNWHLRGRPLHADAGTQRACAAFARWACARVSVLGGGGGAVLLAGAFPAQEPAPSSLCSCNECNGLPPCLPVTSNAPHRPPSPHHPTPPPTHPLPPPPHHPTTHHPPTPTTPPPHHPPTHPQAAPGPALGGHPLPPLLRGPPHQPLAAPPPLAHAHHRHTQARKRRGGMGEGGTCHAQQRSRGGGWCRGVERQGGGGAGAGVAGPCMTLTSICFPAFPGFPRQVTAAATSRCRFHLDS